MRPFLSAVLAGILAVPVGAVEVIPIYKLDLVGGQYFFSGDKSNMNANLRAHAAPVVKMNSDWSILPLYSGYFRGTKDVSDPVGSGTLFQQLMDHHVAVSALYAPEGDTWRFRPSLSYKWEFLKETRDETWGKGLFDYENAGFSFSAENVYRKPFSYRFGYEFYYTRFPNYQSLESQSGTDPNGNPLNRENAGTDVLDTYTNAFTASGSVPFPYDDPKVSIQMGYRFAWQRFHDQPIIAQTGLPNDHRPTHRQDFYNSMSVGILYPRSLRGGMTRAAFGFSVAAAHNGSNQNTYDAGKTQFVSDAYSYYSVNAGPNASLSWGDKNNPSTVGLSYSFSHVRYLGRLVQDTSGNYQNQKQHQQRHVVSLSYGYPVAPNFRLTARTNMLWANSNQAYEATYRYTYETASYLLGFSYDY